MLNKLRTLIQTPEGQQAPGATPLNIDTFEYMQSQHDKSPALNERDEARLPASGPTFEQESAGNLAQEGNPSGARLEEKSQPELRSALVAQLEQQQLGAALDEPKRLQESNDRLKTAVDMTIAYGLPRDLDNLD